MRGLARPAAILLALALLAPRPGAADELRPPDSPAQHRQGLVLGAAVGTTAIDGLTCCTVYGLALGAQLGGMLSPHVALLVDAGAGLAKQDTRTVLHLTLAGAARAWPTDWAWLEAGGGVSHYDPALGGHPVQDDPYPTSNGVVLLLAGGVELLQSRHLVLDLQVRGLIDRHPDGWITDVGVLLGASWY